MRHGTVSINQIAAVLDCLGGKRAVTAMLADRPFPLAKYGTTTLGQVEAGINALGGEWVLEGLISGVLTARCVGDELLIEPAKRPLFDRHGRRIPPSGLKGEVMDTYSGYRFVQPAINYGERLARLAASGLVNADLFRSELAVSSFRYQTARLIESLGSNRPVAK